MWTRNTLVSIALAASLAFAGAAQGEQKERSACARCGDAKARVEGAERIPPAVGVANATPPIGSQQTGAQPARRGQNPETLRRQTELLQSGDLEKAQAAARLAAQAQKAAGLPGMPGRTGSAPSLGSMKPPSIAALREKADASRRGTKLEGILGKDTPGGGPMGKPGVKLGPEHLNPLVGQVSRNAAALRAALKAKGMSDAEIDRALGSDDGGGGNSLPKGAYVPQRAAPFNPFPGMDDGPSPLDHDPSQGGIGTQQNGGKNRGFSGFLETSGGPGMKMVDHYHNGRVVFTEYFQKRKDGTWEKKNPLEWPPKKEAKKKKGKKKKKKATRKAKRKKKKTKKAAVKPGKKSKKKKKKKAPKSSKDEGRPWDGQGTGEITEDTLRRMEAKRTGAVDPVGPDDEVEHDVERLATTILVGEQSTVNPNPEDDGGGEGDGDGGRNPGEGLVHKLEPTIPVPIGKGPRPVVIPPVPGGGRHGGGIAGDLTQGGAAQVQGDGTH